MIFNGNRSHKLHEILKFDPDRQMTSHMIMMRMSLRMSQAYTVDFLKLKESLLDFQIGAASHGLRLKLSTNNIKDKANGCLTT